MTTDHALLDAIWAAYKNLCPEAGVPVLYRYCEDHRILSSADRCELCLKPTLPVPWAKPTKAGGGA